MNWHRLLSVLALLPATLSAQQPTRSQVQAAVDSGNAAYIAAFAEADPEALAQVYDPAGARLSSHGAFSRGRSAITAEVRDFVKQVGPVQVTLESVDLWIIDSLAYETGKWTYTFTPSQKPPRTIGGRYVTVWRYQSDGAWRILADIGVPGTAP
jgi:uncharacterized protein (TIGR02246 family)